MSDSHLPFVSIIIPVKNEGEHIKNTIASALHVRTRHPFEIIVVDDGSTDGCCNFIKSDSFSKPVRLFRTYGLGSANSRNFGAENAAGNYFIFCDAHLFFEDGWLDRLLEPILSGRADATNPGIADTANPDNVGFGFRWLGNLEPLWNPRPIAVTQTPLLAGGCLAISRQVFFDVGGFERGFRVWGREDEEISLKLWLFGYRCCIQPEVKVLHVFRPESPPFALNWDDVNYNLLRMAFSHFNERRIFKCIRIMKNSNTLALLGTILMSDVLKQRRAYFSRRKYSDDWFMNYFNIPF